MARVGVSLDPIPETLLWTLWHRAVEARRPDLRLPFPEGFVQRLTGARVERLDRRAKYLLAPLDRGDTLIMHLGMTGRFEVEDGRKRASPSSGGTSSASTPSVSTSRRFGWSGAIDGSEAAMYSCSFRGEA